MPTFIEPQLAKLVEKPPSGPGWVHEVKFDGYRLQLRVEDGKATLQARAKASTGRTSSRRSPTSPSSCPTA